MNNVEAITAGVIRLREREPQRFQHVLKYCAALSQGRRSDPRWTVQVIAALAGAYLDHTGEHAPKRQLEFLFSAVPPLLWLAATESEKREATDG